MARALVHGLLLACLALAPGCAPPPAPPIEPNRFSAATAFQHVEFLVGLGPRLPASEGSARAADYFVSNLQSYGLHVEEQVFLAATPRGPTRFRNIVARTQRTSGRSAPVIVIGSHYDTKHVEGLVINGANDGGSSSGVLLELARVTADQPDLCFVFFDGEEAFVSYGPEDGLWGSRYFVANLRAEGQVSSVRAMILLDMVGDRDLKITIPSNTTGALAERALEAARLAGYREFFSLRRGEILDDHVPFLEAGIAAVNLIDFEYGSIPQGNDYWHTEADTLDKVSPRSLEIVGQTTLHLLQLLRR